MNGYSVRSNFLTLGILAQLIDQRSQVAFVRTHLA